MDNSQQVLRNIWAPWRMGYILTTDDDQGCFLCAAGSSEVGDRQTLVVFRHGSACAVLNKFPYSNGHILVAPTAHKSDLEELTREEKLDLFDGVVRAKGLLDEAVKPHGFNIGINIARVAGAGVPGHLHVHVVPRWSGDTNFMPVLAGVKVVPQSLEAVLELLIEADKTVGDDSA